MKLVVGLGNPGRKYEGTRHNVGFRVVAELAGKFGKGAARNRFHGETIEADVDGQPVLLLCPSTFMNLSGTSVAEAKGFFKLPDEELLIVCDDLHLPLGTIRFRASGSSGGQKGLEDILRRVGSADLPRLRIGIGQPPDDRQWVDYVLSKFSKEESEQIEIVIRQAADAVALWVGQGIQTCMNRYNRKSNEE